MEEMPKVIIMLGPVGAGKGTQADILAERHGFYHFETSKVIEEQLNAHSDQETIEVDGKTYTYGHERELFNTGILNTPEVVTFWNKEKIRSLAKQGKTIVFSGSPRTMFEAEELIPLLEELYGKDSLRLLVIQVPEEESIFRNSHRRICKQCRTPVPYTEETKNLESCPKCGGELVTRGDLDTPEVIKVRLKEYAERTKPIITYARQRSISVAEVDGIGSIEDVAERIEKALGV